MLNKKAFLHDIQWTYNFWWCTSICMRTLYAHFSRFYQPFDLSVYMYWQENNLWSALCYLSSQIGHQFLEVTLPILLMLDMVIRLDMNFMAVNVMEGGAVFITTYSWGAVGKLIVQDETIKELPTWKATCMEWWKQSKILSTYKYKLWSGDSYVSLLQWRQCIIICKGVLTAEQIYSKLWTCHGGNMTWVSFSITSTEKARTKIILTCHQLQEMGMDEQLWIHFGTSVVMKISVVTATESNLIHIVKTHLIQEKNLVRKTLMLKLLYQSLYYNSQTVTWNA